MIFRLMATILVMSDTGSVSLVATHTDWPSEQQCRAVLASHYTPPPPTIFNGHEVTAKVSASCVPVNLPVGDGQPVATMPPLPPPLANILPRIFPSDPRTRFGPDGLPCGSLTCGNEYR